MTTAEIREALTRVQRAVTVPPVDDLAFRARVRAERRRRTTRRVLAGGAGVVAAAAVVAAGMIDDAGPTAAHRVVPAPAERPSATKQGLAVVSLEGRLDIMQPGDGGYGSDLRVQQVVGRSAAGEAVVVDDRSHLWRVPLAGDGDPGDPVPLAGGRAVQGAWLDKSGDVLAFVDDGNRLHIRPLGRDQDAESVPLLPEQTSLVATDGTRWVEDEGDRLSLRFPDDSHEIRTRADPLSAELAGGVLAVTTKLGTELWDASTSPRELTTLDARLGSLSPDGSTYALWDGTGLAAVATTDPTTRTSIAGLTPDMTPVALTWQDDDRFLVLATSTVRTGNHVLYDCSVALGSCQERYDDPTGTLQIATR